MTTLVVGASGATGRWLVRRLLERGATVKSVVRSPARLPADIRTHARSIVVAGSALEMDAGVLAAHVRGCDAVASCLGHHLTVAGIWGPPWLLVAETTRRLCDAIRSNRPERPVRFALMNTTGNRDRDLAERRSFAERCVLGLVRALVPPQRDNERAAEHLRTLVGRRDAAIEWVVVRPDTLIDADEVTPYVALPSPIRSPVFDAGRVSRINVGDFMAALITDDASWSTWRGRMPVLYDRASSLERTAPPAAGG